MSTILRKDVRAVRVGDRFKLCDREREVVSVRAVALPVYRYTGELRGSVPGVELLHKCPGRAGVEYLEIPVGSQLAVLIP